MVDVTSVEADGVVVVAEPATAEVVVESPAAPEQATAKTRTIEPESLVTVTADLMNAGLLDADLGTRKNTVGETPKKDPTGEVRSFSGGAGRARAGRG